MRLLLLARDTIADRMAGPGIRYWELAHALAARGHDVTLVAPTMDRISPHVRCLSEKQVPFARVLRGQQAVVSQWITPPELRAVRKAGVPFVADAYDPIQLEHLEANRDVAPSLRASRTESLRGVQSLALLSADAVVCASERQRDLWLGALLALGRVTTTAYDEDDRLRQLIDVVPFGCPTDPPQRSGPGPRELFGLSADAVVLLWGGGIWDWFDPLVVIRALALLPDLPLKLVFMGVGTGPKALATEALVEELGLRGTSVFFPDGWVPYEQRQSFLLDADAGISAHLDHGETRFAFRTRVLDYLWAGLPCLLTEGDAMADLVRDAGAGSVQPFGDVEGWRRALVSLAQDTVARKEQAEAAYALGRGFRWPEVAVALEGVIEHVVRNPRPRARTSAAQRREVLRYTVHGGLAVLRDQGASGIVRRFRAGHIF